VSLAAPRRGKRRGRADSWFSKPMTPATNCKAPRAVPVDPEPVQTADLAQIRAALDLAALSYDARQHGPLERIAAYATREGQHSVCINLHPELDWRVIDLGPDEAATFVGRLDGAYDLRDAAVSYAEDYADQCRRYHAGTRPDPPILRPQPMQMTGLLDPRPVANNDRKEVTP
jgi:hypothetical protein